MSISNHSSSPAFPGQSQPLSGNATSLSPKRQRRLLATYVCMIGAWVFDFRSEGAGQGLAIQGVFMLSFLASLGMFLLYAPRTGMRVHGLPAFLGASFLFLAIPVLSGLIRGQEFYALFRNAFSVLCYVVATYATAKIVVLCPLAVLRRVLGWLCLAFSASAFLIVTFFQGGVDLEKSRYEILGASTIAGLALVLLAPIYPLRRVEIASALITIAMTFLSVTRTYLVGMAAQILVLAPAFRRIFRPRTILVLAAAGIIAAAILMSGADVAQRWHDRLFVRDRFAGADPTLISRQSEWDYMWKVTISSPDKLMIGSGYAAETKYYLDNELGGNGESGSTGFGHGQYLSIFFIGGLIGGLPLLLVQTLQGWRSIQVVRRLRRIGKMQPDLAFLGSWGALMVIGVLATSFFMAHLANRGTAIWCGVGTGLLLGTSTLLRRQSISQNA